MPAAGELVRCTDGDTQLVATYVVDRIAAGGRWHCGDGYGAAGVLSDPAASPLADRVVLAGRRLYSSRDELTALVAADSDRAAELLPLINRAGAPRPPQSGSRRSERCTAPPQESGPQRYGAGGRGASLTRISTQEVRGNMSAEFEA